MAAYEPTPQVYESFKEYGVAQGLLQQMNPQAKLVSPFTDAHGTIWENRVHDKWYVKGN